VAEIVRGHDQDLAEEESGRMKIVAGTRPQDQEKGLDPHEGNAKIRVVPAQAALVAPPEVARVDQAPVEAPVAAVTPPDPDQETRRIPEIR
jgi:hypothetical protein